MKERSATGLTGDRLHKLAGTLEMPDVFAMYGEQLTLWHPPESYVVGGKPPGALAGAVEDHRARLDFFHWMMWLDTVTYLPDDILVKVDRASMAVALETRCPILDHRVIEFAWRLPLAYKIEGGTGKRILRTVLARYVPAELFERPKMGFGVPIADWLRGPLRDWAEGLLSESRLREWGVLRPEPVRERWREHLSGTRNWSAHLWVVLMLEAWRESWAHDSRAGPAAEAA
jgi:asparagine synthase (glutamine-hydrolysing)